VPRPPRSAAGYRRYDKGAVHRLRFVRGAQRVGLRLREIGELLEVMDRGQCPCGHTEALLRERLAEVDAQLARLAALRGTRPVARGASRAGLHGQYCPGVVVCAGVLARGR
jgi:DNA-binding transcriptional MerR regulator